jgi:hypothetical protein
MDFYSATKKNEILSFTGKWMELENIIFSQVNQAQKGRLCERGIGQGKETKNLNEVDVLIV